MHVYVCTARILAALKRQYDVHKSPSPLLRRGIYSLRVNKYYSIDYMSFDLNNKRKSNSR
jgi:hypothetical protein